ncbi:putative oxidoreductase [Herbihabitans rhizosphaerae]|uniref:Putative oxidoreductase n=1 Tax=Herbihabitans rhizosphaerae TaxID=1872711 RepID=A0A4Q7KML9_9PSEU|nr:DoxX family protein [Herbihabitans rhizosphaerae]RZS37556.1 putative oxidoreductase [Herbihabitans rhizosphaerae]
MQLLDRGRDHVLAVFRVVIGLLFACHGASKLFGILGRKSPTAPEFGSWPDWWAAAIEFGGGTLVLLGLGTRVAALICSGAMAYAYFVVHQPVALWPLENKGELAAVYCWVFLLIVFFGPGKWALDSLLSKSRSGDSTEPSMAR